MSEGEHPFAVVSEGKDEGHEWEPDEAIVKPILKWLEKEVKARLIHIEERLKHIPSEVRHGSMKDHEGHGHHDAEHHNERHAHMDLSNHHHSHNHHDHGHGHKHHPVPHPVGRGGLRHSARTAVLHSGTDSLEQSSQLEACAFEMGPAAIRAAIELRAMKEAEAQRKEPVVHRVSFVAPVVVDDSESCNSSAFVGAAEAEEDAERSCSKNSSEANEGLQRSSISGLQRFSSGESFVSNTSSKKRAGGGSFRAKTHTRRSITIAHNIAKMTELPSVFHRKDFGWSEEAWQLLDDPESSAQATALAAGMKFFIAGTVLFTLLQTLQPTPLTGVWVVYVETTFDLIFLFEILLRIMVCPNRWHLFVSFYAWIDIMAGAAFFLRAANGFDIIGMEEEGTKIQAYSRNVLLCMLPVVRLMKILRHYQNFHLLFQAFERAAEALPVMMFVQLAITLCAACCIYLVEPRENMPRGLVDAVWLVIVTMTTVGYGDIVPVSAVGLIVTGSLVVFSVFFMAIPVGIIGGAFSEVWDDRYRILLVQRTRTRLLKWGYTVKDIPIIFSIADDDGNGGVDSEEFVRLMQNLKIGLNDDRILELFDHFDDDNSGFIDAEEFVRNVFPNEYHSVYGSAAKRMSAARMSISPSLQDRLTSQGSFLSRTSTASGMEDKGRESVFDSDEDFGGYASETQFNRQTSSENARLESKESSIEASP